MNTRTYNRNSVLAFPKTCDYACAVERPREFDWQDRLVMWACAVCFVLVAVIVVLT
jgi:hypothetical protein